jgi:hypothetical protein
MAAIFVLMIAAELLRGVRVGRKTMLAVFAVAGFAILSNLYFLRGAFDDERLLGEQSRGGLAGLDISRGTVDSAFILTRKHAGVGDLRLISAGPYFAARDEYGSPAYRLSGLAEAPEPARAVADTVTWNALGARVLADPGTPRPGRAPPRALEGHNALTRRQGSCLLITPAGEGIAVLALPPGGIELQPSPGPAPRLRVRRYAEGWRPLGAAPGDGGPVLVRIPPDRSPAPWKLELRASTPVVACGVRPARPSNRS